MKRSPGVREGNRDRKKDPLITSTKTSFLLSLAHQKVKSYRFKPLYSTA
jgi:hypothetical protein